MQLRPDTLVFEPDEGRFFVIARRSFPLNESLLEIEAVAFGEPGKEEPLAPVVPTFIDLDDFRDQLRAGRPQVITPVNWSES